MEEDPLGNRFGRREREALPDPAAGDRSVKGTFNWAGKTNSTKPSYGWLIGTAMPDEPPPSGGMIFVR